MPTIPSRMFGPRIAIHVPERSDKFGRRTADGLRECAAQYVRACSIAARVSKDILARSIAASVSLGSFTLMLRIKGMSGLWQLDDSLSNA